jgi:hypothetical protein
LRGDWGVDFVATAGGQRGLAAIQFAFTLASAPNPNFITGAPTANCPGTSADPTAAPGQLCVYRTESGNTSDSDGCLAKAGGTWTCGEADKMGVTVSVAAAGAGRTHDVGTWAVTAP